MSDQLQIVLIATAWAGGIGLAGGVLAWFLRRRSALWQVTGVAMVAVAAVLAGVLGTANAMFISEHDFYVVLLVALVAGVVGILVAIGVGAGFVSGSRSLREDARRFGDSGQFVSTERGPAEMQAVSDELARTSERLAESAARAARLEESRRELVSWVSHDLRTPLAGMRAMAEALEDGMAGEPGRYHRQIRVEVDRMVRMVDDLFELSRIHAGVLPLSPEPLVLGDVVSEAIAAADPVARSRGVTVGGSVDQRIEVTADPAGLTRVVSNLVMNAIRHTPADGAVEIRAARVSDGVELTVSDGCGGIRDEDMPRVFDLAWQGGAARTPAGDSDPFSTGAGLGLAIVKGIVEAHRGTVAVENQEPGCQFRVVLPA